jgi:predicted Zn-dependent protease
MKRIGALLCFAVFGLSVALAQAQDLNLSSLGKIKSLVQKSQQASQATGASRETEIGAAMAAKLLGSAPLVDDPALQQYVNKVGLWLALQTERSDLAWHFGVIDTQTVNAFAAPGGYVFVTRGLLDKMNDESELAGVLSHEISHVLAQHHLKAIQKGAAVGLMTDVLGMAATERMNSENWNKVVNAGTELYARGLDKQDEFEADRMGVVIAARGGYDPFGLPAVLQTLDGISAQDSHLALMFKTHPAPAARLQALDKAMGTSFDSYASQAPQTPRFEALAR